MEFLDYEGLKLYHDLLMDRMHAEIDAATVEVSDISVPFTSFNSPIYSLTLDYDDDNKLYIKVMKDLKYDLNLVVSPGYVWYGSDPTVTFDVIANDYTRGGISWAFVADGITSASYDKLDPEDNKVFTKGYSDVTTDIVCTLTIGEKQKTGRVYCYIPILYGLSQFKDGASYTSFSSTTNLIGKQHVTNNSYSFDSITPSNDQKTLYVAIPGVKDSIKYLAENTSNETPSIGTITLKINGQDVTYSIFEQCNTVPGATFKLYE